MRIRTHKRFVAAHTLKIGALAGFKYAGKSYQTVLGTDSQNGEQEHCVGDGVS